MTPTLDRIARWHGVRQAVTRLAIVLMALSFLVVTVLVVPNYLAPRSSFGSAADAVHAQNDARGLMLRGAGGLVLLLGAYVTWRQLQLNRDALDNNLRATTAQLKASQDQLTIGAQEGQITQRFAQSVDQLGSEQIVVRLGGIYALERIARNSPVDAATIGEILSSYIRQHVWIGWLQDRRASRYPCREPSWPSAGRPPQNTAAKPASAARFSISPGDSQ